MQGNTENWPDNLLDLFESAVKRFADNKFFGLTAADRSSLSWLTYREVGRRVDHLRAGLHQLGVGSGDTVGIIANNRPEWAIAAFATYGLHGRFVPMYEAELVKTWRYIIADAAVKVLLVSKPEILEKIQDFQEQIPTLERIILIDGAGPDSLTTLEARGAAQPVPSSPCPPENTAVLIYTSGTTGEPKGVLLSHGNLTHVARGGFRKFPILDQQGRSLSILPWAHSYGQVAELYNWLQFGGSIGFMESVATLADDLRLVQPTFLMAVPRVFNRIYSALWATMRETGGLKLTLFQAAVAAATKKRELAEQGQRSRAVELKLALLDRLVFRKIRQRFGGRLSAALTASATMNPAIANFFFDLGIPVYDCYGLTETSPAVTMNCPSAYRLGSVGRPLEGVRVVIDQSVVEAEADDGEILVYGPSVMQGYHNKPTETRAVMTPDGGFRTGDRGRLDEDGFLFITGRIKEQFKLENGKYVFPADIEEDIKLLPEVDNVMIYGDGKPYVIGLVFPNQQELAAYGQRNHLDDELRRVEESPAWHAHLTQEIAGQLKGKYGGYEIPRKFVFLEEDFTLENGMLTQTMKVKRRVVVARYDDKIQAMYQDTSPVSSRRAMSAPA